MKTRRILKIIITLGLLAVLVMKVDIVESLGLFGRLDLPSIGAIFLVTFWLIFVSVLKWQMFLRSLSLGNAFWRLYRFYVIGYFFSNFLPSNIGGDAVRLALTAKSKDTCTSSFAAVFMERFTGIAATLLFVAISLPLVLLKFDFMQRTPLVVVPTTAILGLIAGLLFIRPGFFDRWKPANALFRICLVKIREILAHIHSFRNRKPLLAKAMFLSIIFNGLAILNVYVVGRALELPVHLLDMFLLVPLILVISAIPLSINAIGIAESAYVICLSQIGLNGPEALSVALLMRAKTLVVSLLGGLFFLGHKKRHEFAVPEEVKSPADHAIT